MSERYKLELYLIRDNELEFALYDKEAETSQGTTKMIENKLNRQDKIIEKLKNRIEELEYELVCLDGLYVTDVYESALKINDNCWQLNLKPLINKGLDEDD